MDILLFMLHAVIANRPKEGVAIAAASRLCSSYSIRVK